MFYLYNVFCHNINFARIQSRSPHFYQASETDYFVLFFCFPYPIICPQLLILSPILFSFGKILEMCQEKTLQVLSVSLGGQFTSLYTGPQPQWLSGRRGGKNQILVRGRQYKESNILCFDIYFDFGKKEQMKGLSVLYSSHLLSCGKSQ